MIFNEYGSGLSAAIYLRRFTRKVALFDKGNSKFWNPRDIDFSQATHLDRWTDGGEAGFG